MTSAGQGGVLNNGAVGSGVLAAGIMNAEGVATESEISSADATVQDLYVMNEGNNDVTSTRSQVSAAIAEAPEDVRKRNERFVAAPAPHVVMIKTMSLLDPGYPPMFGRNMPSSPADAVVDERAGQLADLGYKVTIIDQSWRGCDFNSRDNDKVLRFPPYQDGRVREIDMSYMKPVRFNSYTPLALGRQLALFIYDEARAKGTPPWNYVDWFDAHGTAGAFLAQVVEKSWDVLRTGEDIRKRFGPVIGKRPLISYPGELTQAYGKDERPLHASLGGALVDAWREYWENLRPCPYRSYRDEKVEDLAQLVAGKFGWNQDQVAEFLRVYDVDRHSGFAWNLVARAKPGHPAMPHEDASYDSAFVAEHRDHEVTHDLGMALMRVTFGTEPPRFGQRGLEAIRRIIWTPGQNDRVYTPPQYIVERRTDFTWSDIQRALFGVDIWGPGAQLKDFEYESLPRLSPAAALVAYEPEMLRWAIDRGAQESMPAIGFDPIEDPKAYVKHVHAIIAGGASVFK